jgi:cell division protein FtsL
MIRVMNFFCVALMGLAILALYHVSERTRVARLELAKVNHEISRQHSDIAVLETEWQHVAAPSRVQRLAESRLGMSDNASAQLSSFDLLPRRGDEAPLNNTPLRNANAVLPTSPARTIAVSAPVASSPDSGM